MEASQEVEFMWTEEQEMLAVRKESVVHFRCVPPSNTLDKFKVYSFTRVTANGTVHSTARLTPVLRSSSHLLLARHVVHPGMTRRGRAGISTRSPRTTTSCCNVVQLPSDCSPAIKPKGELKAVYLPAMLFLDGGERMVGSDGGPVQESTAPRTRVSAELGYVSLQYVRFMAAGVCRASPPKMGFDADPRHGEHV